MKKTGTYSMDQFQQAMPAQATFEHGTPAWCFNELRKAFVAANYKYLVPTARLRAEAKDMWKKLDQDFSPVAAALANWPAFRSFLATALKRKEEKLPELPTIPFLHANLTQILMFQQKALTQQEDTAFSDGAVKW